MIDRAVNNRLCASMGAEPQNIARDLAASIFRWWDDAGVDTLVTESRHDWLGTRKQVTPRATAPLTHAEFVAWLKTADLPEAGPPHRRLMPAGDPASDLMILADFPEAADIESGEHLSGALSSLFGRMLGALGRDRDSVYVATLCPGRPPSGRLAQESVDELAETALRHIGFIAPKQLWLMGSAASRAILGIDDARAKGKLHSVNLDGVIIRTIATAHPRFFEGSKARKAAAWAEMQRLMA